LIVSLYLSGCTLDKLPVSKNPSRRFKIDFIEDRSSLGMSTEVTSE